MKKLIPFLCLLCLYASVYSQTPQSVPYQAVARNAAGNLMQNQNISLRFTVHDATSGGTTLYQETQPATTNNLGLFSVNIGTGTIVTGTFSSIPWGNGNAKYMQVEIDPNGGSSYTSLGATQMMSVPYALYAANAGSSSGNEPIITAGTVAQYWRGDKTWQTLNTTVVPEGTNLYYTNARGIGSTLTGYSSTTGTISSADNILTAIEKLNGNLGALVSGVSSVNGNTGAVALTGSSSISISGADVFSINSSYTGQSSIATLGTISTGTWNGTAIGATYGGTGLNTSTSTGFPYVTSGTWSVISAATALSNLGAESTTAFNSAVSGTTGQVTYFNGTNSVTGSANHTWANATNQLSVGLSSTTANPSLTVVGANAGGGVLTSTNTSTTAASSGVYGAESGAGTTYGVYGANSGNGGTGVYGLNNSTGAGSQYGVYGAKTGATGTGTGYGIYGTATGTGATNIAGYFTASGGTANYSIIVPSGGGNAGINTSSPLANLDIAGSTLHRGANTNTPSALVSAVEFMTGRTNANALVSGQTTADIAFQYGNGGYRHFIATRHNGVAGSNQNAIDFYLNNSTTAGGSSAPGTGNTEMMSITETGVGIATNAPTTKLQVAGGGTQDLIVGNTGSSQQLMLGNSGSSYSVIQAILQGTAVDALALNPGGGNVGIGTSTPGAPLDIESTNTTSYNPIAHLFMPGNTGAGNVTQMRMGVSASGNNCVEYRFVYNSSGSSTNIAEIGMYGTTGIAINGNGWIGVGTTNPGAPIDVETSTSISSSGYSYGLSGGNGPNEGYNSAEAVSIRTNQNILCGGALLALSDARIKNVEGYSDAAADLATLNKIKITDYTMRDKVSFGNKQFKKVIAQQLKEVYPLAVNICSTGKVIPNIYRLANSYEINGNEIVIQMPVSVSDTNIKVGAACKFYLNDKQGKDVEEKGTIASFSSAQMRITTEKPLNRSDYNDNLFVYGTEIHDLLSVDYDAISMLNVSATQELAKRLAAVEAEYKLLKNSNASLQQENSKLKCSIDTKADAMDVNKVKAQLEDLKILMDKNGIRTER